MKVKPIYCDISEVVINDQRYIPFKKTTMSAAIHGKSVITGVLLQDNQVVLNFFGNCEVKGKQRGRKKATAKHIAMHFCYLLMKSRNKSDGYIYRKIMELFGYRDERELRRICKRAPKDVKGSLYLKAMGTDGKNNGLVTLFEEREAVTVTADTLTIDGAGWAWQEGETEAVYGNWSGSGKGTFDPSAMAWEGENSRSNLSLGGKSDSQLTPWGRIPYR